MDSLQATFDNYDPITFNKYAYYLRALITDNGIKSEIDANIATEREQLNENNQLTHEEKLFKIGFPIIEGTVKFLNYSFKIHLDSTSPNVKNLFLKHYFDTMRRMQQTFGKNDLRAYSLYIMYLKSFIPDKDYRGCLEETISNGKSLLEINPYLDQELLEYTVNFSVIGDCMKYLNGTLQIVKRDVIINADRSDQSLPQPGSMARSPLSGRLIAPQNLVESPFDLVSTIGDRMTGKIVLDSIVAIYGDRGTGKSETSGYLAERIAIWLSKIKGGKPSDYFTINNVRSVDKKGTLDMFSSDQLIAKPNQILIADDISIAANARNFFTEENKRLNDIITVSRIYRHCVILNTVATNLVDNVLRQFADIGIQTMGPDPETGVNELKVVIFSNPGITSKKKDQFKRFFQFQGSDGMTNRITRMRVTRPSSTFRDEYYELRKRNTDKFVREEFKSNGNEKTDPVVDSIIPGSRRLHELYNIHGATVKNMMNSKNPKTGKPWSIRAIGQATGGLHDYWVNKIIARIRAEGEVKS